MAAEHWPETKRQSFEAVFTELLDAGEVFYVGPARPDCVLDVISSPALFDLLKRCGIIDGVL